jgi:hypothetical protein
LAFLIVSELILAPGPSPYKGEGKLALGTAAFVAFVPQHVAMLAGVNNDSLAELLMAATMWSTLQGARGKVNWVVIGVLLGLGMITKLSFYIAVPLVAWAVTQHASRITQHALRIALPALLIALPWWTRNLTVYGWPDVFAQLRHNAVVVGQPTSAEWIVQYGWGDLLERFFTFTFQSFWGQFGWMTVLMPPRYYQALGVLSLFALTGCIWAAWPHWRAMLPDVRCQLLGAWVILNILMYLYYNLTFVQHQGRYLFLSLIPIGLAFTVGLRRWTLVLPRTWRNVVLALPYLGLAALDLWALFRMIVPALQ